MRMTTIYIHTHIHILDVGEALMASGALPLFLTPPVGFTNTFRGERIVDGGGTNNTPVFTGNVRGHVCVCVCVCVRVCAYE